MVRHRAIRVAAALSAACLQLVGRPVSGAPAPISATVLDRIGAEALATQKAPGFSLAVVQNGKLIYAKGFGLADVARDIAVMPQTRFAVGSVTKQFIAAGILLLVQRGTVALSDSLTMHVPGIPNGDAITLQMMLNQTSGLHNYPQIREHAWPTAGAIALSKIVSILATDRPDFAPGSQWEYSNANYTLLAAVIEKASQTDAAAFLTANIFAPLAMRASGYGFSAQQQPDLAKAYSGAGTFTQQESISLDLAAGAGGIISSALDMGAWDIALMNGNLLDAHSIDRLWTAGKLTNGTSFPYAMGFVTATLAGHREVWHTGFTPGAGGYCYNAIFPDDKLAVVVLSNGADFELVPEHMVAQVLAAFDPQTAAQLSAPPASAPGEDPMVTTRAKDWFYRLQTGTVDLSQVDARFAQMLTPDFLAQIKTAFASAGTSADWIYVGKQNVPGAVISKYWIRLGGEAHTFSIGLTPDGKIAGSLLK